MATFPKLKETIIKKIPSLLDTTAAAYLGTMLETHVKKPIDDLYSLTQEMKECKSIEESLEKFIEDENFEIPKEQMDKLDKFVKLNKEDKTLQMKLESSADKNLNALSELLKHRIEKDMSRNKTSDKGISV